MTHAGTNQGSLNEQTCASLESLLEQLTTAHESMLELTREHKRAIERADAAAIGRCCARQRELIEAIAQLEAARTDVISQALGEASTRAPQTLLTDLAARARGPARERLLSAAGRLRELIEVIATENKAVRQATHALLAHMEGLVRQVGAALSPAGTYGRQGRADAGSPVASGIDIRH